MEQPAELAGPRIASGDIRAFVPVTVEASQGKVVGNRRATMLARTDVVDMKRQRINGGRQPAVFAAALRPAPDLPNQALVHERGRLRGLRRRAALALDWITASKLPTCR